MRSRLFLWFTLPGSGQPRPSTECIVLCQKMVPDVTSLIPGRRGTLSRLDCPVRFSSDTALRDTNSSPQRRPSKINANMLVRREHSRGPLFRVSLHRGWEIFVVVQAEILTDGGANRIPRTYITLLCSHVQLIRFIPGADANLRSRRLSSHTINGAGLPRTCFQFGSNLVIARGAGQQYSAGCGPGDLN